MLKNSLFKFFGSLKLAVFVILTLASVLATATILESLYGTKAAYLLVYGTAWFYGLLFLLGTVVLCAAISRFPWKKTQTGFVITHLGILILLFGSFLTQRWGVDGNLPVLEGSQDNSVILTDPKLFVNEEESGSQSEYPIYESAWDKKSKMIEVNLSEKTRLTVDQYIPRAIAKRKIQNLSDKGLGVPIVNLEIYNSRFRINESIILQHPTQASELNLGPALVTLRKLWEQKEENLFLNQIKKSVEKKGKGYLIVSVRGKEYRVLIENEMNQWALLGASGLEYKVLRYLPYAVVDNNELSSRSDDPVNPAIEFIIRERNRSESEETHTVFANFPEFPTLHGSKAKQQKLGLSARMISSEKQSKNENLAMVGNKRGELRFAVSEDNQKLYYQSFGKDGKLNAKGVVETGKETATGWMDLKFKVTEWLPLGVEEQIPHYVEQISQGSDNLVSAIHLNVNQDDDFWLFEGTGRFLSLEGRDVYLQYGKKKISLPFQIQLEKFTLGTDPGTSKAATYESRVRVNDPLNPSTQSYLISMNEPMVYGGYTFYQASYQLEEGRAPVSVFAVNYDPGRWVKYAGSLLMVLGIALMFWMNPHYWNLIFRKKEV